MDIATLIGIISGLGLIIGAIILKGNISSFFDPPSILIVIGGTLAVTLIMYPLKTVLSSFKVAMKAFLFKSPDTSNLVNELVELANLARRDSLVALEKANIEDPFVKKGCMLAADGTEAQLVRSVLKTEISFMQQRHATGQGVFKNMGLMSPAFGMIGTLIGLVQMLQTLEDPSSIGPAMAVALLTTFYGAVLANVVFTPLSKKLEERSAEETLYLQVALEGVVSIANGEHPNIVKDKLESFLSPMERSSKS